MGAVTLDTIGAGENVYPSRVLEGQRTALVLFAAGFLGRQDAYWIHKAGLRAVCVDIDAEKLLEMAGLYPADWLFADVDAYRFCQHATIRWDVVSLDPPTGQFAAVAEKVDLWCARANHAVILGSGPDFHVKTPEGWTVTETLQRSEYRGGVYWTVLERADV